MIIKRNNSVEEIDIKQIRDALVWASEGLDVNYIELETYIDSIYSQNISTKEIQSSLISQALNLTTSEEPEWRIVAARLLLMENYKEAAANRSYSNFGYSDYYTFVKTAVDKGLYDENILNIYTEEELIELGEYINPNYDLDFDYAGINMIFKRYLLQDGNDIFELPQELFMTISAWIASVEKKENRVKWAKKIYDMIAGRKISLATPILINLRRKNANLSSCFISAVDDSLDSIFYNIDTVAQISKRAGGVGLNMSRLRASGSEINKVPNASGGVLPWIKIINDTAIAVNQQGKRAGAVTVALDIWHKDIEEFLELQTENGDQRRKAYDIFPQIVISDLFMERVEKEENWTTFDPNEVRLKYNKEIAELYGDDFKEFYKILENDKELKLKKIVNAKDLLIRIMKVQIETGMPYLFFKDSVNKNNPNKHAGYIGSGNLCQESFSNFKPSIINKTKIEDDKIIKEVDSGEVHTCNLVSINLSLIEELNEIEELTEVSVRILDNSIDLTITPIPEGNIHNKRYRTIGIGAMGLADYLAKRKILFLDSSEAVDELFENIAYYSVKASSDLAGERGSYEKFKGSDWSKGILFGKIENELLENSYLKEKWSILIDNIKKIGLRNGQLLAIAPNTSSALIQGCSPSILPIYSKFYIDKNSRGTVPICPPFINDYFWFYQENKNINQKELVNIVSTIQKWIDQGISFELIFNLNNGIKAKDIYETIMAAWKKGCKTLYYVRTIQKNSNLISQKEECISCAN